MVPLPNAPRHSITVISGLSKGTGAISAATVMEHGGNTVGIIPCGILTFNLSPRLTQLFDPERFLIMSPFSPAEEYSPFNSMARNRIISALAGAVFIVETPSEGGLIDAAKSAHKIGTPIFTAEFSEYGASASGNESLVKNFDAKWIRGRRERDKIIPNLDYLISAVRYGTVSK